MRVISRISPFDCSDCLSLGADQSRFSTVQKDWLRWNRRAVFGKICIFDQNAGSELPGRVSGGNVFECLSVEIALIDHEMEFTPVTHAHFCAPVAEQLEQELIGTVR